MCMDCYLLFSQSLKFRIIIPAKKINEVYTEEKGREPEIAREEWMEQGVQMAHWMYSIRALSTAVKNSPTPIPVRADTPTVCTQHTCTVYSSAD